MSYLDEEDTQGSRRSARGGASTDSQTLWVRRGLAVVALVVLVLLLVFGVRACFDSREERAYRDYVRDVGAIVAESKQQSDSLFELLGNPGGGRSPVDLANDVNGLRVQADRLVERARGLEQPSDEVEEAHRYLVQTLEFRRDGLVQIGEAVPTALGDEGRERTDATTDIAARMQNFLASDVIYSQRYRPGVRTVLAREQVAGADVPASQGFLPDIDWLRPNVVSDRLERIRGDASATTTAPGLHGTGLGQVSVDPGGTVLAEGGAAAELPASESLTFSVQVTNQGESTETGVRVSVSIRGSGRPVEEEIPSLEAGQTETVTIPFADTPPVGQPVEIQVQVAPVPGERVRDNNSASFTAIFTR